MDEADLTSLDERCRTAVRRERIGIVFPQPNLLPSLPVVDQRLDHQRARSTDVLLTAITRELSEASVMGTHHDGFAGDADRAIRPRDGRIPDPVDDTMPSPAG